MLTAARRGRRGTRTLDVEVAEETTRPRRGGAGRGWLLKSQGPRDVRLFIIEGESNGRREEEEEKKIKKSRRGWSIFLKNKFQVFSFSFCLLSHRASLSLTSGPQELTPVGLTGDTRGAHAG